MFFTPKFFLGAVVVFAILTAPAWAGSNSSHRDSALFDAAQATTIGSTQLQPGRYILEANENQSQLHVLKDGKEIASVPCHWVQLQKKPSDSRVLSNNNQVNEIKFQGRIQAAKVG
jgi:hypothetical protein